MKNKLPMHFKVVNEINPHDLVKIRKPKLRINLSKEQLKSRLQGLYFLFNNNEIVYIGKSENILKRIKDHRRKKIFTHYTYIPIDSRVELSIFEFYYINKYKPVLNKKMW